MIPIVLYWAMGISASQGVLDVYRHCKIIRLHVCGLICFALRPTNTPLIMTMGEKIYNNCDNNPEKIHIGYWFTNT